MEVTSIRFGHHRIGESLGIGESSPRISWKITGNETNWVQSSCDIEIIRSNNESNQPQVFHIESSDSVLLAWPTTPLESRERAEVRVRVTGGGTAPNQTSWSKSVTVEAGLLDRGDWTAQMIGAKRTLTVNDSLRPALFRKPFRIGKLIKSARLYITSYGVYEAKINGTKIGNHVLAPGWTSYKHHLNYQTFDVTNLLTKGENVIGAEVAEGWYCGRLGFGGGRRYIYGDRLAILAQLEILFEDGEKLNICSDESWKTSVGPIVSSEIYDGEVYDASLEVKGWSSPSFNDETWTKIEEIEFPTTKLQAPEGPPVRKTGILKTQKVFKSPTGKTIMDFGQNLVGWVHVRVSGPKGNKITFTHTEVLENGEVATRPLRECKAMDSLILSGEPLEWEPKFTFHGFRYVQVEGWPSSTGSPAPQEIEAVVIHTDMEQTGYFECSDPMINKLHENIRWGMRGNFVGIPTDCPQRDERLGWTGDIQIFAPTANFLYNTTGMLSSWLKDLAVETIDDEPKNVVPLVVPNVIDTKITFPEAAWGDAAIIVPWTLYQSSGDISTLANQYESMKIWLEEGIPRGSNGLWDPECHQLGDWLDPAAPPSRPGDGKTDPHFVANAYLVHVTALMAQISNLLNLEVDSKKYSTEAEKLKKEFQNNYITPSGRLAPDTATSLSLALSFSLFASPTHTLAASHRLAHQIRTSSFKISTGFVGTPLILPALTATNQTQLAYRMLLERKCPSWLYPITMGATTMWERWDSMLPDGSINPGKMTSFNHYALGSVGSWLHGIVGGISPAEPGWSFVNFEPVPGGTITWAKVRFEGPYGRVRCEWRIENGRFRMEVEIPPNSRGVVKLPGRKEVRKVESGRWEFDVGYVEVEWPPMAIDNPFEEHDVND